MPLSGIWDRVYISVSGFRDSVAILLLSNSDKFNFTYFQQNRVREEYALVIPSLCWIPNSFYQIDILSNYLVSFHVLQIFIEDMRDEKKGLLVPSVILHQLKA